MTNQVHYVAIARSTTVTDKVILASYAQPGTLPCVQQNSRVLVVLRSPSWTDYMSPQLELVDGPDKVAILKGDGGRVAIAITTGAYPERLVFGKLLPALLQFMDTLKDASLVVTVPGGLQKQAGSFLETTCADFNKPDIDLITSVQAKVAAVTGIMAKNIEAAQRNTDQIEDLDTKARVLADSAGLFASRANTLKQAMRCRYWKLALLFGCLSAVLLTVIVVPVVLKAQAAQ